MDKTINYGFIRPVIDETHYIYGASPLNMPDILPSGDWRPYLPKYEAQADKYETFGCTVWGSQNQLEILLKLYEGIEHNFDERFTYNVVGINPPGTNPQLTYEANRKYGFTEGVLPMPDTLEEFKTPRPMTEEYYADAQGFKYTVYHEWGWTNNPGKEFRLNLLRTLLKKSPVAVSVTAWMNTSGLYVDNGQPNSHWCICVAMDGDSPIVFDSYDQSLKTLSPDHHIEVSKVIYLGQKVVNRQSLIMSLLTVIGQTLGLIKKQIDLIPPPIMDTYQEVKDTVKRTKLDDFCLAIRDYEGKPGDLNYRNNNPGNCRCSSQGYKPIYGKVICKNGFAVFESYEKGWLYLQNLVTNKIKTHPTWTIINFFENYAPTGDNNNPYKYASYVAARCGLKEYDKVSLVL